MSRGAMSMDWAPAFSTSHTASRPDERTRALAAVGFESLEALMARVMPEGIRLQEPLDTGALGAGISENACLEEARGFADLNLAGMRSGDADVISLIGQGYYGTSTPSVIVRNFLENPGWYTAYTPYQSEISQGRLELLLNFQQMIMDLTGLDVANASLLDEASAAAEAACMMLRLRRGQGGIFLDRRVFRQTRAVVATRLKSLGGTLVEGVLGEDPIPDTCAGVMVQVPDMTGAVRDVRAAVQEARARGLKVTMICDPLALVLLESPGALGADIAVGSSQRFGVPMGCGGPHAAYIACRREDVRALPGRIIGWSMDLHGAPALRMALQTREQHIRRDKATSNICTAQVLPANMGLLYALWHGPQGLRRIAEGVHAATARLAEALRAGGYEVTSEAFFDTLTVRASGQALKLQSALQAAGVDVFLVDADHFSLSLDETTGAEALERVRGALSLKTLPAAEAEDALEGFRRTDAILTHPVFHEHQGETRLLRYMRRLVNKDLALDRTMIPLGSCTMKLNAATEMIPITWPGFAHVHPFAPPERLEGYRRLIEALKGQLCALTGFDDVSFQPNAGSQGEYAGLLAIRGYLESQGEGGRDVCLIPTSAHGTNPASAVLAGLRVVAVACDKAGNIDVEDFDSKIAEHGGQLAAMMVTYPSTHGVFEQSIVRLCRTVHEAGGQVYLDGANLNALVGWSRVADLGADVSHMNLHKTFCIPHGGGGPGMGPIGVRAHLVPFLPRHCMAEGMEEGGVSVGGAPWGSASILPISWSYIRMMGEEGLREATAVAILNANYLRVRLESHYPVLYTGEGGFVAHECILDFRGIRQSTGVTVEDVVKRLMDYGFHGPTMNFPVPETLMIEPTESEPLSELDRFVEAMVLIREEIRGIEEGRIGLEDSPLRHAPHTASCVVSEEWDRVYSRREAVYPTAHCLEDKYWPPVGRVDNIYGDRHLRCGLDQL